MTAEGEEEVKEERRGHEPAWKQKKRHERKGETTAS